MWKLNLSLLEDEKAQQPFKQCSPGWTTLRARYWNHTEWWTSIKDRTKAATYAQVYRVATGAKFNMAKGTCMALGKLGDLSTLRVSVLCKGAKILGVFFDSEWKGQNV